MPVDYDDIQGLVRFGYRRLTQACFLLLRVRDAEAARAWLRAVRRSAARADRGAAARRTAMQVALSCPGLRALGVPEDIIEGFSPNSSPA